MTAFTVRKIVVFLQVYMLTRSNDIDGIFVEAGDDLVMDKSLQACESGADKVAKLAECKPRERILDTFGLNGAKYLYPGSIKVVKCDGCCGPNENICCKPTKTKTRNVTLYSIGVSRAAATTEIYQISDDSKCKCLPRTSTPGNCSEPIPVDIAPTSRQIQSKQKEITFNVFP